MVPPVVNPPVDIPIPGVIAYMVFSTVMSVMFMFPIASGFKVMVVVLETTAPLVITVVAPVLGVVIV